MQESFTSCIIRIVGKLGGVNMTVSVQTHNIKNFIGGKWVDANTAEYHDVPNPATGKTLARVPISTSEDLHDAVKAAKTAFNTWSKIPVPKRARILFKYQQLLTDNHEELAKLVTQENGKAYKEAYGEVLRGIECVEFATGAPSLMMGDRKSTRLNSSHVAIAYAVFCLK